MDEKTQVQTESLPAFGEESYYPDALTDEFELLEVMSEEEAGETLLVKRRTDGRLFAAKCYMPESPLFDRTEPESLHHLQGGLMPAFVADIRDEKMRCILREYIPGENLKRAANARSFSEEEITQIGLSLCEQLSQLHALEPPVIHRDIKPENVILRPDGKVSLIDFGIAKEYIPGGEDTVAFGTKGFAPPEQYGFSQSDVRSDIYSLGKLLEWLCRAQPGASSASSGVASGVTSVAASGMPSSDLLHVIRKCTAFDPEKRYSHVSEVKKALQRAASRKAGKKRRRLTAAAAAACVLLAAAALIGLQAVRQAQSVHFAEPLIEEAVRKNLGLSEHDLLKKKDLAAVTGIYIVGERAFASEDEFYPAVNDMYAEGGVVRGTLSSLSDLAAMTGLEQICIAAERLQSLEDIKKLENLNKIEIKHNDVEDLSPLAGMLDLTSVGINDNPVQDLSPLTKCPQLAFLDLCDARSYDPAVIGDLGDFIYLDIANPTESYRYLSGKCIRMLRLAWTDLSSLDDLSGVTGLENLDIAHTQVTDLTGLKEHTDLTDLNLADLTVDSLNVLTELPQLNNVILSADMEPLAQALGDVPFTIRYE